MHFQGNRFRLSILLVFMLLVAACSATVSPVSPTSVSAGSGVAESTAEPPAERIPAAACASPTGGAQLFANEAGGYCFHLPPGFMVKDFGPGSDLIVYAPTSTPGHRERAFVAVEPAVGRTAADAADAAVAALPGFTPSRSDAMLGTLPAAVLDGLPGQDLQRKVFAVSGERLFTLTFVPASADPPDALAEMEELYALVLASFTALPPTAPVTLVAEPVLVWQGDVQGECHMLQINAASEAAAGRCGDEPAATSRLSPGNGEWDAIREHFGPIDAHTPDGRVILASSGAATGQRWGEALAAWAKVTAQELIAGRTSAAGRTVVAWQLAELDDQPGRCRHLIVLAYGYAYANAMPCGGGQAEQVATGWLSGEELETLATWRMEHARVEDAAGYVDALGIAPLTAADVTVWAAAVYDRLTQ